MPQTWIERRIASETHLLVSTEKCTNYLSNYDETFDTAF